MLNQQQVVRLEMSLRELRKCPGWRFLQQLIIAESAGAEPDLEGLKEEIVEGFATVLQGEIDSALLRRTGS